MCTRDSCFLIVKYLHN
uniref:Ribosomal protein L20 n=1 Tax=Mirabilis himalaica TaxID=482968 RepID=A0A7D4XN45_9CARY|nr:ribosomal protein L20 [Mirabilis himalaica]QKX48413.1 ribosomal protein L20 [Mirabilis himalaica]